MAPGAPGCLPCGLPERVREERFGAGSSQMASPTTAVYRWWRRPGRVGPQRRDHAFELGQTRQQGRVLSTQGRVLSVLGRQQRRDVIACRLRTRTHDPNSSGSPGGRRQPVTQAEQLPLTLRYVADGKCMPRQPRVTTHLDHSDGDPTPATERRQRRVKRSQRPQPASRPTLRGGAVYGGGVCFSVFGHAKARCVARDADCSARPPRLGIGGTRCIPKSARRTSSSTSSMTQAATTPRPFTVLEQLIRNSGRGLQLHHGGQGVGHRDHRPCEHRGMTCAARSSWPPRGCRRARPPAELAVRRRRDPRRRPGGPHGPGRAAASEAPGRPAVLLGTAGHRAGVGGRARLQRAGVHRRHPRLALSTATIRSRSSWSTTIHRRHRDIPRPSATRGCASSASPRPARPPR